MLRFRLEPGVDQLNVVGFTAQELAYLLSLNQTGGGDRIVEQLHLGADWNSLEIIAIGASSLLARGDLFSDDGVTLEPTGRALEIGAILTLSKRETEFAVVANELTEAAILFESAGGTLLCQPRALGTWWFTPIAQSAGRGDVIGEVISVLAEAIHGSIALTIRSTTDRASATLTARRVAGEGWEVAYGETGATEPQVERLEDDPTEVVALIALWANTLGDG